MGVTIVGWFQIDWNIMEITFQLQSMWNMAYDLSLRANNDFFLNASIAPIDKEALFALVQENWFDMESFRFGCGISGSLLLCVIIFFWIKSQQKILSLFFFKLTSLFIGKMFRFNPMNVLDE